MRYLSLISALLPIAILSFGCSSSPDSTPNTSSTSYAVTACANDKACSTGSTCQEGLCLVRCSNDSECLGGSTCQAGACYVSKGSACAKDADCPQQFACQSETCLELPPVLGCSADAQCPAGSACQSGNCVGVPHACSPKAEVCGNGLDDDCDGIVDNDCQKPQGCTSNADCGKGTCVNGVCSDSNPPACTPSQELCNGLDDDCDGIVDNGCQKPQGCTSNADCGKGTCVNGICNDSNPPACTPSQELCNGLDDDCNGLVDDGCGDAKACAADSDCPSGQACVNGLCARANPPGCVASPEVCNGMDDDCNGIADDNCGDSVTCKSNEECDKGQACVNGVCTGINPPGCSPAPESCNGLDDDCDGMVDEGC